MTDERILLDNLHGRISGMLALCTVMVAAHPESKAVMMLFKEELKRMRHPEDDNYFLGLKSIHDHLENSIDQTRLDLALLLQESDHVS